MRADVIRDMARADRHDQQLRDLLTGLLPWMTNVHVASQQDDMKAGTDYESNGVRIATRLRETSYRDFTIRSQRTMGVRTELSKMQANETPRWYFYGWLVNDHIHDWMLLDIDKIRCAGLLDQRREQIPNTDRMTAFVAISIAELQAARAIVRSSGIE